MAGPGTLLRLLALLHLLRWMSQTVSGPLARPHRAGTRSSDPTPNSHAGGCRWAASRRVSRTLQQGRIQFHRQSPAGLPDA